MAAYSRPYSVPEQPLSPPDVEPTPDPRIEKLLDLADDLQFIFRGSFVQINVIVHPEDSPWADPVDVSDAPTRYSVVVTPRRATT